MSEQPAASRIRVEALADGFQARAQQWAEQLGLPLQLADADFALQVGEHGLQLQQLILHFTADQRVQGRKRFVHQQDFCVGG